MWLFSSIKKQTQCCVKVKPDYECVQETGYSSASVGPGKSGTGIAVSQGLASDLCS